MKPNPIDMKNDILNFWNTPKNGVDEARENPTVDELSKQVLELAQQLDTLSQRVLSLAEQSCQTLLIVEQITNDVIELKHKSKTDGAEKEAELLEVKKDKSMQQIFKEHTDAKEAWNKSKRGTKPTLVALWEDWKKHGHEIDAYPRFNYLFENGFMTFEDYQIWKQGRQG